MVSPEGRWGNVDGGGRVRRRLRAGNEEIDEIFDRAVVDEDSSMELADPRIHDGLAIMIDICFCVSNVHGLFLRSFGGVDLISAIPEGPEQAGPSKREEEKDILYAFYVG